MRIPRTVQLLLAFAVGALCYYYYHNYYRVRAMPSPLTSTPLPTEFVTLPPSEYKVVEMNGRKPFFKLATTGGQKPYADGDRAQETVVNSLKLADQCQRDPSLIVVDIGAFLGMLHQYRNTLES